MVSSEKMILIGKVLGAHGIKGEFKIKIGAEYIDYVINNFNSLKFYNQQGCEYKIKIKRHNNLIFIAQINDINNRNDAEELGKIPLFCPYSSLPSLQDEEFYYSDLKGKKVYNSSQEEIGEIINVMNFGASDIIEINFLNGQREMFPFTKTIFPKIEKDFLIFVPPHFL